MKKEGINMKRPGPEGPFCQSCGMSMNIPECFGTNIDGAQNNDYCCHCFYNGEFTNPNI